MADLTLSLTEARRLAVRSQYLAGSPPAAGTDGMRQVLRGLRVLQLDPVNVVARSHLLVLWSRLGAFDTGDLETLLWRDRWLFEYWAHSASLVLTEDYPIRRYILDTLRDSGPLPIDAFEDRAMYVPKHKRQFVFRRRRLGSLLRPGRARRILTAGESAGRSRRAQAR